MNNQIKCLAVLTVILRFLHPKSLMAEDRADYRYEDYNEEHHRVHIRTHAAMFEKSLLPWLTLKGEYVYDGISGATPTGAAPVAGSRDVPVTELTDIRRAGYIEPTFHFGRHTITPQVAYSEESDYRSLGASLSYSLDLNKKNTTLTVGLGHNFDTIQPKFWIGPDHKDSTDVMLGVTQLLGPKTTLTANLTLGTTGGFIADPYKIVQWNNPLDAFDLPLGYPITTAEKRPKHKTRQVMFVSLTQYFDKLDGSLEGSYRFGHDSFDIFSHTVELTWFQKLGSRLTLAPSVRYYHQSEAYFYVTEINSWGDPGYDPFNNVPRYYSADFRLAEMDTWTYGMKATYKASDHLHFDVAFKRYEMSPSDGKSYASAFPSANVFTIGLGTWF